MKALLLIFVWLPAFAAPATEGWWNRDWKYRRPLVVANRLDRPLEKGFTLQVEVDPDYLGIREKSKAGLEDWALVRGETRIPIMIQPGRGKSVILSFRSAETIRAGGTDSYHLYYGAPDAIALPAAQGQIYEYWEDFSRLETPGQRFNPDPGLTAAIQDGALVIREVETNRPASQPARLVFKDFPSLAGFELSFDLEMDSSAAAAAAFSLTIDLKEPGGNDEALKKKIEELIGQLGDDRWDFREKSTKDLIRIGRPAVAALTQALGASDVEVKWRADHILKEIRLKSPAPRIAAGVQAGDAAMPVALTSVIGGNITRMSHRAGWPVRTRVVIQRDPDGDVKMLWNGRLPQSGQMAGEIREVAFTVYKGSTAPLGVIKIDNIIVRRYVDEDSRPTSTIDLEELRP